ncbi:VF530 family DNA-binding protein [Roseivirga sp.]|uniref:VF530 family protein n=1 Tax=Roseivirga sp. TaxID=1964215 RepID=UPI003B8CD6F2
MELKYTRKNTSTQQANNPLHGVKLADILEYLVATQGWDKMANSVSINCFKSNPTIKSSLKFLRRTPWARTKVEEFYLEAIKGKSK